MIAQSVTMGITWIFKILIILVKRNVPINNTAITGPITGIQVATTVMTTAPIAITTQYTHVLDVLTTYSMMTIGG
jgi:hypothetical protein